MSIYIVNYVFAKQGKNKTKPYFSRCKAFKACNGDFIIWADFVIISRVVESKGQQTLFLQISFC